MSDTLEEKRVKLHALSKEYADLAAQVDAEEKALLANQVVTEVEAWRVLNLPKSGLTLGKCTLLKKDDMYYAGAQRVIFREQLEYLQGNPGNSFYASEELAKADALAGYKHHYREAATFAASYEKLKG